MARIRKILVANRGEIAVRIMRSCREMGIASVAVYSDADRNAVHTRLADEAVHLGASESHASYLSIERILDAARRTGADAIHPGYGFLSENGAFAEACVNAGIVFIGPRAQTIRAMGMKKEAKAIARRAGVEVVPGYDGAEQSVAAFATKANEIGFPVLLKASAGGGGKGMRIVRAAADVNDAFASAKREAQNAFGNDELLLEKYIDKPRHVEVQILGDEHDNLVHLFERECSIQRRHQKLIEESPSPALDADLRYRMGRAAVDVARAIDYSNAGTVEFIVAPDGNFYFLEVNTRLQVEHPVTELVTGLDLVREQIRIARGEPLGYSQQDVQQKGAAIECRICAEDASEGFMPATGRVLAYEEPSGEGVRVDSGIAQASEVGIYYDSMVAKVIAHGANRDEARERLEQALRQLVLLGVTTNRSFLLRVLGHEAFQKGLLHTHFLEEQLGKAATVDEKPALTAALLWGCAQRESARAVLPSLPAGYRNNFALDQELTFVTKKGESQIGYRHLGQSRYRIRIANEESTVTRIACEGARVVFEMDGLRRDAHVANDALDYFVHDGANDLFLREKERFPDPSEQIQRGGCIAPMPGKVMRVHARVGERVEKGAPLVAIEAMKMEHLVIAPHAGTVRELCVREGEQVRAHAVLVIVDE